MQLSIQTTIHSLTLTTSLLFAMSSFNPVMSAHAQETALQSVSTGEIVQQQPQKHSEPAKISESKPHSLVPATTQSRQQSTTKQHPAENTKVWWESLIGR